MKKIIMVILVASSIVLIPSIQAVEPATQTFQDKPALTPSERIVADFLPSYVAGMVGLSGGLASMYLINKWIEQRARSRMPFRGCTRTEILHGNIQLQIDRTKYLNLDIDPDPTAWRRAWRPNPRTGPSTRDIMKALMWGVPGLVVGEVVGYKISDMLAVYKLSRNHGVSYRVEKISQYYNINVGQYRTILTAAEQRKADGLIKAIDELYPKRFGSDWRNRMQTLFAKYEAQAPALVKRGSFDKKLNDDERDFVRMIELGAAMANLYYKTQPSRKNVVDSAMKLYKELGYLTNKGGVS